MGLLSEAQRAQYRSQGYLVVEDLFGPADCEALNRHAEAVVMEQVPMPERCAVWLEPDAEAQGLVRPENRYQYLFKIGHQMQMSDALFQRYAMHPALVELLEGLVGPDIKCVQSMFIDKPAGLGVGQPYHQDAWYL
ncbi:MAG: hypothetical protein EXS58_06805 [Candidatus Latescibacteria bacterium]|nr:hypothetical protein [Candidatus Latescibacterota bacterium]